MNIPSGFSEILTLDEVFTKYKNHLQFLAKVTGNNPEKNGFTFKRYCELLKRKNYRII